MDINELGNSEFWYQFPWDKLKSGDPDNLQLTRKKIITRCPEFETKLDENQANLIHLASEYGYVEIVKGLIFDGVIQQPCFCYDKNSRRSPLYYATMKGKTEVIQVLLDTVSISATSSPVCAQVELMTALHISLRENQCQAFCALAIKYMEIKNWDSYKVAQIKRTNKLLTETPRPSDDVPTGVVEALNEKLLSIFRSQSWTKYHELEVFLARDPLLVRSLSSRSCPLEIQFYFCVLTKQTDDLLDEIYRMKYENELICEDGQAEGREEIKTYQIHSVSRWGFNHILELILIYKSGSACLLKDMDGNTPLHCAAQWGKVSIINILLSNCWECAGIVSDKKNETALHCALRENKAKAFKTLLGWYIIKEEFLNNNARDWDCGDTSLDLVDGYEKIVKELFGQPESKVCFQREYWGAEHYFVVIKCKNTGSIGTTFKYQEYIREVTSKPTNRTILSLSMDSRSIITMKVLIRSVMVRKLFDVKDVKGKTVFYLLDTDKEVTATNVMGFVPYERYENVIWLLDAMQTGDYEDFSKLIVEDRGILDYVCALPLGGPPVHIAVRVGHLNDCTRWIIRKQSVYATMVDHKRRHPIHIASAEGSLDIVKELLAQYGLDQLFSSTEKYEILRDQCHETPLDYAIQRGRISVINELLPIWWKCAGIISREEDSTFLRSAANGQHFEAFKMLMERYIENELLKAKQVDGSPMSALADGYIEIVLKHLLSPKVDYSLSILVEDGDDEETMGTELPLSDLYFAVIKVTSSSKKKDINIVDEIQLSSYYPKYFCEVIVGKKMVVHLLKDDENSVTLKLLLESPLFYEHYNYGDGIFQLLQEDLGNKVVEYETGILLPIWSNKKTDACRSSSINIYDNAKKQLGEGTKNGHEGPVSYGNEEQLSVPAEENHKNMLENAKADHRNNNAEDDNEEPHDQEMPTDMSTPYRLDGHTMRNQRRTSFRIRQVFTSFEECSNAIRDAAILGNAEVNFKYLGMQKIFADCSNTSMCNWKIRAYSKGSNFVVTEIENEHKCQRSEETTNKLATPKWVSSQIIEKVRQDPKISPRDIIEFIKSKYHVGISYRTALEAKNKWALKKINGIESKENTIHGSQSESKKRKRKSTSSSSLSPNALPSRWLNLRFLEYIPTPMHKYIQSTEDVEKDGHCGYRVIAKQLGYEAMHGWKQVRRELLFEVVQNEDLYIKLSDLVIVKKMRKAFAYSGEHATDHQYWLRLLDAGYVIANAYKAVVVSLSVKEGNLTFLPLLEPPPEGPPHRIITFGFVNGDHFISVNLKPDAPIPRVNPGWDRNVSMEAVKVWEIPYQSRFCKFEEIMRINQGNKNSSGGFLTV